MSRTDERRGRATATLMGSSPTRTGHFLAQISTDALTDDPHLNAAEIEVEVRDGEATLLGSVDSRDVQNDLRVAKRPDRP